MRYGGIFCDKLGESVFPRRHPDLLLEQPCEVLGVLETEFVGHLIDGQFTIHDVLLREVDDLVLDVALSREARFLLDEIAKVAGREENLLGEVGDAGQALALGLAAAEVRLQVVLEAGYDVAVHLVARDELAVVVAHAVVQEQADGIGDEPLRVLIDGVLQLLLDAVEQVADDALLTLREVQGLALVVVEERIVVDALGQRCAVDQIRMEQQSARGRHGLLLVPFHLNHLSWHEAHDGSLLVVVLLASVADRTALALLQEQCIEAVVQPRVVHRHGRLRRMVHDGHQRVQRFPSVQLVVRIDRIDLDNFFLPYY